MTTQRTIILSVLAGAIALTGVALSARTEAATPCAAPSKADSARKGSLTAFGSEAELGELIKCFVDEARRRQEEDRHRLKGLAQSGDAVPGSQPVPAPASPAPAASSKSKSDSESVTNTQTAGVDEGGIVKVHGDHLVILRRGRLFTVDIRQDRLKPVDAADAFGPDIDPAGAWYDEMLITGDTIVVIGYSYQRGGTELGLFNIDAGGKLTYRATYQLRSNDYFSSRNYASRLIGSKLIFYTPLYLNWYNSDPYAAFPAMRKWRKNASAADFKRIAPATRIYRTDDDVESVHGMTLHTVSVCDLATPEMECQATALMGPPGRVFYVSANSVYVWTTQYSYQQNVPARSAVFRIPLDGSAPSALKTAGAPVDQFSFLESADGYLNVLVRAQGRGDAMWAGERSKGTAALLRASLASFGDGRDSAPASAYREIPESGGYTLQNRFIGNFLLYGTGSSWGWPAGERRDLFAVRWDRDAAPQTLRLAHSIDRIEALGNDAVAVGTLGSKLLFSSIRLGTTANFTGLYSRNDASQGETRSHGFFYKPEGEDQGLLGLPIVAGGQPGYRQLGRESAAVLFLRNKSLQLTELGALPSHPDRGMQDGCRASCVDWYGNSRPLFLRNRVFALMGYELVEGRVEGGHIREVRRTSFAPR